VTPGGSVESRKSQNLNKSTEKRAGMIVAE